MKILVVDDSIVFRSAICKVLGSVPDIEVVRSVSNGKIAVEFMQNNPDVELITLDMEMPVMDGMMAISEIRKFNQDVIIIVFSSLTSIGAEKTIKALSTGANDFVTKPEFTDDVNLDQYQLIERDLMPKVLEFKKKIELSPIRTPSTNSRQDQNSRTTVQHNVIPKDLSGAFSPRPFRGETRKVDILAIGSSTGGPDVLSKIFEKLNRSIDGCILLVQHMPPVFTEKLAEMLNRISAVEVIEAKDGMKLQKNYCYVAPGDFHLTVEGECLRLLQTEKVCFVRPSVDVLLNSLAKQSRFSIATFILTGMGEDGASGVMNLHKKNTQVFIQNKESSIVWGMPGAVAKNISGIPELGPGDFPDLIYRLLS